MVSLSTLKTIDRGDHIRPEQFKQIRTMMGTTALDWIELKIRYAEAYMQEYILVPEAGATLDSNLVTDFATERKRRIKQYGSDSNWKDRLSFHVCDRLRLAGAEALSLADASGGKVRKRDMHSVKYPTVTALRRGEHVRPEKFGAVCRRLKLSKTDLAALKISYVEGFLGEFLLGRDTVIWGDIQPVRHPRTLSLLIFSTQNIETLA